MRGGLLLTSTRSPIDAPDHSIRDWLAELTNQLLGRIKNKLIALGTIIHCSTPTVLRGYSIAPLSTGEVQPYLFAGAGGYVSVWFDAEIRPEFELVPTSTSPSTVQEGETLLF
jgi:hypothetical protein